MKEKTDDFWLYELWDRYDKELEKRTAKANDIQVQNVPITLVLENVEVIEFTARQVKELRLKKVKEDTCCPLYAMQLFFSEKKPCIAAKRLKEFPDIVWVEFQGKEYHLIWHGMHDDELNTLQKISKRAGRDLFEVTVK